MLGLTPGRWPERETQKEDSRRTACGRGRTAEALGRDGSPTLFSLIMVTKKETIIKNSQNVKFLRKARNVGSKPCRAV